MTDQTEIQYAVTLNERGLCSGRYISNIHPVLPEGAVVVSKDDWDTMLDGNHTCRVMGDGAYALYPVTDEQKAEWAIEDSYQKYSYTEVLDAKTEDTKFARQARQQEGFLYNNKLVKADNDMLMGLMALIMSYGITRADNAEVNWKVSPGTYIALPSKAEAIIFTGYVDDFIELCFKAEEETVAHLQGLSDGAIRAANSSAIFTGKFTGLDSEGLYSV